MVSLYALGSYVWSYGAFCNFGKDLPSKSCSTSQRISDFLTGRSLTPSDEEGKLRRELLYLSARQDNRLMTCNMNEISVIYLLCAGILLCLVQIIRFMKWDDHTEIR